MRKLYFKLVLAIWAVMIISSAGAVAMVKVMSPEDFGRPENIDGRQPRPFLEQIVPTIVTRATLESEGAGEEELIAWFRNDAFLARAGAYLLSDSAGRSLLQWGDQDKLAVPANGSLRSRGGTQTVNFEHDGREYSLAVYLPDVPEPRLRPPGAWQRAIAMFAFRPGNVWLLVLIAVPLSVISSVAVARYLVTPLASLQQASRQLAEGDFSVRVGPSLGRRGDEIADFAATFDQMATQLEALVRSHKELLRDVSHELRSPLARVHAALSLARQRTKGAVDVEMDRIELEVDRLNNLIEKLLVFARLDAKQANVAKEPIDIADVLMDVVSDTVIEARADNKRIDVPDIKGLYVLGDAGLLASCFENVVRNAVQHSPQGAPIEITVHRLAGSPEHCEVEVRDHGKGVSKDDVDRIFDPFVKAGQDHRGSVAGAGIGLAIAKKAAALHGGDISAKNADGGGLLVTVKLPLLAS